MEYWYAAWRLSLILWTGHLLIEIRDDHNQHAKSYARATALLLLFAAFLGIAGGYESVSSWQAYQWRLNSQLYLILAPILMCNYFYYRRGEVGRAIIRTILALSTYLVIMIMIEACNIAAYDQGIVPLSIFIAATTALLAMVAINTQRVVREIKGRGDLSNHKKGE